MSIVNRTTLKSYFETGDTPTEVQYINLIDSCFNLNEDSIIIPLAAAASQLDSDLSVATSQAIFAAPYAMTITHVFAHVGTAPTGSSILVDINKNATTILSSDLSIAASSKNSSVTVPSVTSLAQLDELTIDVNQVGATIAGKDLTVYILAKAT